MTLDGTWSTKLRKVGALELPDHWFLNSEDECYYIGNYTPGRNFNYSEVNQIIYNLKMDVSLKNEYRYRYKRNDILKCGRAIGSALNSQLSSVSLIVPVPPSKPRDHCQYDDRVARIARAAENFETAELLSTNIPRDPAHLSKDRKRSIEAVYNTLSVDLTGYKGQSVCILIDDVLTTGASFKACKQKILELGIFQRIFGVFVARCAWPKIEFDAIDA